MAISQLVELPLWSRKTSDFSFLICGWLEFKQTRIFVRHFLHSWYCSDLFCDLHLFQQSREHFVLRLAFSFFMTTGQTHRRCSRQHFRTDSKAEIQIWLFRRENLCLSQTECTLSSLGMSFKWNDGPLSLQKTYLTAAELQHSTGLLFLYRKVFRISGSLLWSLADFKIEICLSCDYLKTSRLGG